MRRNAKITAARLLPRKTAVGASAMVRGDFPAWIDAEQGLAFPALAPVVLPRVRDNLILRAVPFAKTKRVRSSSDVRGGR